MRINKYIASCGICSRRNAEKLILKNKIKINNKQAFLTDSVSNKDIVTINDKKITPQNSVYILLNKPKNYTCTVKKIKGEKNILELIKITEKIFPVGRLDKDSQGLILLTNDGNFAQKIIHPKYNHEKVYEVKTNKNITPDQIKYLLRGVNIITDDKKYFVKAKKIKSIGLKKLEITIMEGRKRQIKKMLNKINLNTLELKRTKLFNLTLDNLAVGKWRYLDNNELQKLSQF